MTSTSYQTYPLPRRLDRVVLDADLGAEDAVEQSGDSWAIAGHRIAIRTAAGAVDHVDCLNGETDLLCDIREGSAGAALVLDLVV